MNPRLTLVVALLLASPSSAQIDPNLLSGLTARNLGPGTMSGRISAIDVVQSDTNRIYVGAATGGVWRSNDAGLTWEPIFDDQPVASIGSIAIFQPNPDVIWVGTGEGAVRNSTSIGRGIFKSTDGGETWTSMGLENTERINQVTVHPTDRDIVYVAAMGTLWGENQNRGIYKTTDGGETWTKILYVDEKTGGTDVKLDPFNPEKVYAAMWQFRRWPYHFISGGPGSGMYVSTDGGESWEQRLSEDGLPDGPHGRMVIAPSPAQRGLVYALVEAEENALVRSTDGGRHWETMNTERWIVDRPFYYTELFADPNIPGRVYNLSTLARVSNDGGKTFVQLPQITCCAPGNFIHIDNHAFWINPDDSNHLIDGNDGGIAISYDAGMNWRFVENLPLAQFYHVSVDNEDPYNIYGGLQDNGSWRGPAEVRENGGIRNLHWQEVGFGDGFDVSPDPRNSRTGFSMSQGGNLYRYDLDEGELRAMRPDPPDDGTELRFNWNAGIARDPFDPGTIYYGSQFVHRSTDLGLTWEVISDDLTSNDPALQTFRKSGGLTPDVTAAENYTTIVSIAPSPIERDVIWVGTDDGRVHLTRDGGESWTRIDKLPGRLAGAWIPMIEPSPHDAGTAFIAVDDHRRSQMSPHLFRVTGYGSIWADLAKAPMDGYALSVRQDHVDPNLIFAGTELGLFFTLDGGRSWTKWTAGVPTVSVMDMVIQKREDDLVLGTHGRGVFVIDDYSVLRDLSEASFGAKLDLLDTTTALQYMPRQTPSSRFAGATEWRAPNEPYGGAITFMASGPELPIPDEEADRERRIKLRTEEQRFEEQLFHPSAYVTIPEEEPEDEEAGAETDEEKEEKKEDEKPKVTVKVSDESGVIRTFRAPIVRGLNRIYWDTAIDGAEPMPSPEQKPLEDGLPAGPAVPPGTYSVQIEYGESSDSGTIEVVHDPDSRYGVDERRERFRIQTEMLELERRLVAAVKRINRSNEDLAMIKTRLGERKDDDSAKALLEEATALEKQLKGWEEKLRVPPGTKGIVYDDDRASSILGLAQFMLRSTFDAPSPTVLEYVEPARTVLNERLRELDAFYASNVEPFRQKLEGANLGLLVTSP
ncbi:MAG: hypothetical protein KY459_00060 [Acidobacteria bacterium]|nr:hypothetical protein [Acidobacteriota bacterium]